MVDGIGLAFYSCFPCESGSAEVEQVYYGLDTLPLTQTTVKTRRKIKAVTPTSGLSSSAARLLREAALLHLCQFCKTG